MLKWFMNLFKHRPVADEPKQLPPAPTIECGMCKVQLESKEIYQHWRTAHTTAAKEHQKVAEFAGPMRSSVRRHSEVLIVRRASYHFGYQNRFNTEMMTAEYFAYVIISLKQDNPNMRFQYVPVCLGGTGELLKTLLIVCEWDEE